ncbi:hypothetical protein [Cesiribacter andamanensis]|uniref:Uncharacterized protein n=1 Tax=Cesiribacter andamanensis AMV16 TaxID=1279009 RepID=M7NSF2_9BACT|nr:hypothetical protein [Cesiribacter andamanensis]EMR01404.1 hypothetical protein ADICEAN_03464 [Cesiribacter andamanensis AMV16]
MRRYENLFLLPMPLQGGQVSYVFRQHNRQDTLSIRFRTEAILQPHECGLLLKPRDVAIDMAGTSLQADSMVVVPRFTFYILAHDTPTLAVFVP